MGKELGALLDELLGALIPVVVSCMVIYLVFWVFKSGSYFFFYEDMVQDTIREMVKPQYLMAPK